mgnify:FL=1
MKGRTKLVRATEAVVMGENARIYLPAAAPWLDDFCDQLTAFTGIEAEEEDDQVDALGIVARQVNLLRQITARPAELPVVLMEGKSSW